MGEKDKAIYQYNGTCLAVEDWDFRQDVSFDDLVDVVKLTHSATQAGAVRELRRQVTSNLHIRVGLSKNPEKCLALAAGEENSAQLMVRDPYSLEFLGLRTKDVVTETDKYYTIWTN